MKASDFQPSNFASSETGLTTALTYAGVGGRVWTGPMSTTITTIITIPNQCELHLGAGTWTFNGASGISIGSWSRLYGMGYGKTQLKVGSTFTGTAVVFNTTQNGTQQYALAEATLFPYTTLFRSRKSVV